MWSPPRCEILTSRCANLMAPFMSKFIPLIRSSFVQKCIRPVHFCSPRITPNWHYCNMYVFNSKIPKSPCSSSQTFRNIGLMRMAQWALTTVIAGDLARLYVGSKLMDYHQCPTISRKKLGPWYITWIVAKALTTWPHLQVSGWLPMSRRLNREVAPMSRRPNRDSMPLHKPEAFFNEWLPPMTCSLVDQSLLWSC